MAEKNMEEEFLTCTICFDVYKEPKTLSCLHRFCGKCLHNYILSQKKSSLQKLCGFPCPVCREVTKVPEQSKDPSEWTSLLKTDFHLTGLIGFVEKKRSTAAKSCSTKHACDVHKDKELDLYCQDCEVIICHLCAGINHRICGDVVTLQEVASKRKLLIKKSLILIDKEIDDINLIRERTLDHFEKLKSNTETLIKKSANEWRCAVDQEEKRLLGNLENYCRKVYERITPKLVEFDGKISIFNKKSKTFKSNYDGLSDHDVISSFPREVGLNTFGLDMYKHVVTRLRHLNIQFKHGPKPELNMGCILLHTQQDQMSSQTPRQIEIKSETGSSMVYTIDNRTSVLYSTDFSQNDNPFNGLSQPATNNSVTKSLRDKLSKLIPSSFSQSGSSAPSPEHNSTRTSPKKRSDSHREVRSCIPDDVTNPKIQKSRPVCQASTSATENTFVQKLRTISTRSRNDTVEPKLRDVIVMGHGGSTVIVTDWANQSVKAFCVRKDKDSRLEVGGKPWSITPLSDTTAAVSLPLSKQICILKTSSPLTMQKSFVAAKNYSGLATLNSNMLVASGGNDPPCVDIINLYGEILRSFSTSQDGSPLFMYPSYVCVTPSTSILVSDKKQGAVICMSHTGEINFKFKPEPPRKLQEPCGLCTTRSGHVMVLESRGLLQLTPGGQLDRPLIRSVDGFIKSPKGVAVDSEGLVYVTTDEENVAVYKLGER